MHRSPPADDSRLDKSHKSGRHRPGIARVLAGGMAIFGGGGAALSAGLQIKTALGLLVSVAGSLFVLFGLLFVVSFSARPSRARAITKGFCGVCAVLTGVVFGVVVTSHHDAGSSFDASAPAVSGEVVVVCTSGAAVAGIWISDDLDTRGGRFATSLVTAPRTQLVRPVTLFSFDHAAGHSYTAHVGCGGTPAEWRTVGHSEPIVADAHSLVCYDIPNDLTFGTCSAA
jgi:hypothetical protein